MYADSQSRLFVGVEVSGYTGFKHPNGRLIKKGTRRQRGLAFRMREAERTAEHQEVLRDPSQAN